jgi:hypothetical protein
MNTFDPRWRTRPKQDGPVIDMTADGEFVDVRRPGALPFPAKVAGVGVLVAIVAGAIGIAMLALWLAMTLIPIAIAGGLVAYGVVRLQLWQAHRRSLGGKRDLFRP